MRILDEQGREIALEEVDFNLGYLKDEIIISQIIPEQKHYKVGHFYFDDGTFYTPVTEDDPHINIIDAKTGRFTYVAQEGEEEKKVRGIDIRLVIDQEYQEFKEEIQRYILYTEYEKIQRAIPQRVEVIEENLQEADTTLEDLVLLLAEVLGGEEPEEEPEE